MSAATLEFWFEFASPYSYIGASRIGRLCADAGVPLVWRPFLLGPIFEMQGWNTSHFNLNPWRGKYMWRDMERLTEKYGLPWRKPATFPKNTVLAARVAAAFSDEAWMPAYTLDAFAANFGDDRDLNDRAVVIDILDQASVDGESIVDSALTSPRRDSLRRNTERAIECGIFGAPNCLVGDELFWGEEALEDAVDWARRHPLQSVEHASDAGVYVGPEL
jgi:2-hydroxychromene-2-carboxylate isomerase